LQKHGYDGVYREYKKGNFEAVAFEPTQIKSAIGNKGTWSKTDPDITSSLAYRAANIICAAQAKVKDSPKSHAKARETAQAIYEAAAIAAAAKLRAEKVKRERELEIAAILLLLLLAGEEAYKKVYSVLGGFAGFKNFDEAKLSEQSEAFAESRQADLQEFAGKLADTISDAQAEAEDEGLGAKEAARRIRKAATKESRRMVDVESTVTFGNVNLDRLRRAGFISVFWNQEDRPTKRHSHHLNEEQGIVPLGFLFSSGQRYPGDPNGGVGECINCGCYLEGVQRA